MVDDLVAVTIIAIFYTADLNWCRWGPRGAAGAVRLAVQRRVRAWWILIPLAASHLGVRARVRHPRHGRGVLLGFTVPVVRRRPRRPDAGPGLAEHFEHRIRPLSAGVAVPIFAFFAAGVAIGGLSGLTESLSDPIALGIVAGLVLGKPVGILGAAWLRGPVHPRQPGRRAQLARRPGGPPARRHRLHRLPPHRRARVRRDSVATEHVKVGILTGSLVAALVAGLLVKTRDRTYRRIAVAEAVDSDADGVPDVYEHHRDPGADG